MKMSNRCLTDYYRCDESLAPFTLTAELSADEGYFRLGPDTICYGKLSSGHVAGKPGGSLDDVAGFLSMNGAGPCLPFDPVQVIEHLRREHYEPSLVPGRERMVTKEWVQHTYYFLRNILPTPIRRFLQRAYFSDWKTRLFPAWPVDFTVDLLHEKLLRHSMESAGLRRVPFIWFWPGGAPGCLILTHDVETKAGRDFTARLMDLDVSYGFRASFQVIPEKRYEVSPRYVEEIRSRGFEFNIHDLNHDGHLYRQRDEFLRRAKQINQYARQYQAQGFRAGSMYRIQDWFDAYEFSYDMSVPNVAHLEPKRGGCCTVFPHFLGKILELPLTTSQDYSIFHILRDYSLELWKRQYDLIRRKNGLLSFLSHPDYLISHRTRKVYEGLLDYLRHRVDSEQIWAALPGEVDQWWRARSQMKLVHKGSSWEIEGPQKERARVAYAVLEGDQLHYQLADASEENRAQALSTEPVKQVQEK